MWAGPDPQEAPPAAGASRADGTGGGDPDDRARHTTPPGATPRSEPPADPRSETRSEPDSEPRRVPHEEPRRLPSAETHSVPGTEPPLPLPAGGGPAGEPARQALHGGGDRDTVALGGGQRFVVTAATWLRPEGYVEWEGALCRARWQGSASAYPRPGDLVRVTVTPDSEPPSLVAGPLH